MESFSRKRSLVWNFFSLADEKATCEFCSSTISYKGGSTTNLHRHLNKKHPGVVDPNSKLKLEYVIQSEADEEEISSEMPLELSGQPSTSIAHVKPTNSLPVACGSSADLTLISLSANASKQINDQLVRMIVKEFHPLSVVQNTEFRKFIRMLNPEYSLPTKNDLVHNLLPELYQSTLLTVKTNLESASAVALCIDQWTSTTKQNYVAIIANFLSEECLLISHLLECLSYNEKHATEDLSSAMKKVVKVWNIEDKIIAIVSTNATNVSSAIRQCDWPYIPCFAHTISQIVQTGIQSIEETQLKVRAIVEHFQSSNASSFLASAQKKLCQPEKKLKRDVYTRWTSTYDMLARILEIKEPVMIALSNTNNNSESLSPREWAIIEKACEVLKVFYEVSIEISHEEYVSLSKVILLTNAMKKQLMKFPQDNSLPEEIIKMVDKLKGELNNHFENIEYCSLQAESTLLDPRFKKQAFNQKSSFDKAYKSITEEAGKIQVGKQEMTVKEQDVSEPPSLLWEDFDKKVSQFVSPKDAMTTAISEVDKFLQEQYIGRRTNPLLWWKDRKLIYPRLFEIMKRRLCITATSAPCNYFFSKQGQNLSERRAKLSPKNVSRVLFLNFNL